MIRNSEYESSKLANVLFSNELARKLEGEVWGCVLCSHVSCSVIDTICIMHSTGTGVTSNSLHPGVVATDLWRFIPSVFRWCVSATMISVEDGAKSSV